MVNYKKVLKLVLSYGMFLLFVVELYLNGANIQTVSILTLFAASLFVDHIFAKMSLKENHILLVYFIMWLDIIGLLWGYDAISNYDKIIHFFNAILLTIIVNAYFVKSKKRRYLFIFLSVVGILAMWEIYEYLIDIILSLHTQGVFSSLGQMLLSPIDDTMQDIIVGTLGSFIAVLTLKSKHSSKRSV